MSILISILVWLVVGGVVGWVASLLMKTDAQQGIFLNIVVGIVGAFLGGLLISPMVGVPDINSGVISVGTVLVSFVGAVILLAIVSLFRRNRSRRVAIHRVSGNVPVSNRGATRNAPRSRRLRLRVRVR